MEPPVISPASGTVFATSQTITMACASEGATIHYTRDGSEPTIDSPVYGRFRISTKTTVKARAFLGDVASSEIVTAEYALGQCPTPVIVSAGGESFSQAGNVVTINYDCDEGVVRYTLDGSEPTAASPVYQTPFAVDESVVIKAKAFSDRYFDSQVATVTLTRTRTKVATPVIVAATTFTGSQTMVNITCTTEGAVIRYTLDGSTPNSHSTRYSGPFAVDKTTTIKAYATRTDYTNSGIVTKTVTKVWGIGDTMGAPDQKFTTSGAAGWIDDGGVAMKSGAITHNQRSVLSTVVSGEGRLSFEWKTSCERDEEYHEWDHLELKVDGVVVMILDGITDWIAVEHAIKGTGSHTVEWTYVKDDLESDGDDCAWVRKFAWAATQSATETQTTAVPVPYTWIDRYFPGTKDYEVKAKSTAANGVNTVEACYVAGLDPTNPFSVFSAKIKLVDGQPVVTWSPDLNEGGTKPARVYKTFGRESLDDAKGWSMPVTSKHRFFKVTVEMP